MTQAQIRDLVAGYLDEDRAAPQRYNSDTIINLSIQYAARIYSFLTLAIESTGTLTLTLPTNRTFVSVINAFPLWICPLRITQNNAHISRDTLMSFRARKNAWRNDTGIPQRYAQVGAHGLAFHPPPVSGAVAVFQVRYAAFASTVADIMAEDHQGLADGAAAIAAGLFLGGQYTPGADERLKRFLDCISMRAKHVRERSQLNRYDTLPAEISKEAAKALLKAVTGK